MERLDQRLFYEIEERLSVFKFTNLQSFLTIMQVARQYGFTVEQIEAYIQESIDNIGGSRRLQNDLVDGHLILKECPECGGKMKIEDVNTCKGSIIPGGWKSVFTCLRERECGHQLYLRESGRSVINRILRDKKVMDKYKLTNRLPHGINNK